MPAVVEGSEILVRGEYARRAAIKALSFTRWDPKRKAWIAPATPSCAQQLSDLHFNNYSNEVLVLAESWKWQFTRRIPGDWENTDDTFFVKSKLPSWNHQKKATARYLNALVGYLAMEMGTAKSKIMVDLVCHRALQSICILAPGSALGVWPREFRKHGVLPYEVRPLHKVDYRTIKKRQRRAQEFVDLCRVKMRPCAVVVNHEAAWRQPMADWIKGAEFDCLIIDEIHRAKDPNGRFSLFLSELVKHIPMRFGLSGTPMPHSPLDVFAQFRALDPGVFGPSYAAFKTRYSGESSWLQDNPLHKWRLKDETGAWREETITVEAVADACGVKPKVVRMWEVGAIELWDSAVNDLADITGIKDFKECYLRWFESKPAEGMVSIINSEELHNKFYSMAYRVTKDVLDLPDLMHQQIPVQLCPKARKFYDEIETDFYARIEEGEMTIANSLVAAIRLAEATSGYAKVDDPPVIIDTAKAEALKDILSDIDKPAVVICRFRHDLAVVERIAEELGKVYGEISGRRPKDLTEDATMPEDIEVMGVQIQAGGVGIDLTRASIGIFFSIWFSWGDYDQMINRLHRPGQTENTLFLHITAEDTIDEAIYRVLERRGNMIDAFLERKPQ